MINPAAMGARHWTKWALIFLLTTCLLTAAACLEGDAPPEDNVVEQLKKNAEEFEYTIGKQGGTLTTATISEPLTFNLAISTDAASSDVLGYLFEGLTETSWLTNEVEPSLGRVLGVFRRWPDLDLPSKAGRAMARRRTLHCPRRGLHIQSNHLQRRYSGKQPALLQFPASG